MRKNVSIHSNFAFRNSRLTKQIKNMRHQVKELTIRLKGSEELFRDKFSRELHDQLGTGITGLSISLNMICNSADSELPEDVLAHAADCQMLVEEMAQQIRWIIADLRPPSLDEWGVSKAVKIYSKTFQRRFGIKVTVAESEAVPRLGSPIEITLYRVAQEALTNIAKHSMAKSVEIHFDVLPEAIRMTVLDDGVGFELDSEKISGWGLVTMEERMLDVGGHLTVHTGLGQGTRIEAVVAR